MQVYVLLRSFVNTQRGDERAWPGQRLLARGLGVSKAHTGGAAIAELVAVGAVDVETAPSKTGRRNIYTVHEAPPPGYTGLGSTQELIAVLAAAEALAGRPTGPPPPAAKPARACPATSRTRRRPGGAAGRDTAGSRQKPPGQGGVCRKNGTERPEVERPEGGGDARAREPTGHRGSRARPRPHPPSPRPEPRPASVPNSAPPADPLPAPVPITGPEAALVSELGRVS